MTTTSAIPASREQTNPARPPRLLDVLRGTSDRTFLLHPIGGQAVSGTRRLPCISGSVATWQRHSLNVRLSYDLRGFQSPEYFANRWELEGVS
jgi:hypothetical protein